MTHSPEPWEAIEVDDGLMAYGIVCKNQPNLKNPPNDIACIWYRGGKKKTAANAARIVNCVNACAGIANETLELVATTIETKSAFDGYIDTKLELIKAKQQRDDLLNVMYNIVKADKTKYDYCGSPHARNPAGELPEIGKRWATPAEMAREAIAKAGEA